LTDRECHLLRTCFLAAGVKPPTFILTGDKMTKEKPNNPVSDKEIFIDCSCGCSVLKITQWEQDGDIDDGDVYISHYITSWNAMQGSFIQRFLERMKILFTIARGKEYYFFDLILSSEEKVRKFKEQVARLDESKTIFK